MGVNLSKYGFTQQELEKIRRESQYKEGNLIAYARSLQSKWSKIINLD
jgi:hypothetical protein